MNPEMEQGEYEEYEEEGYEYEDDDEYLLN